MEDVEDFELKKIGKSFMEFYSGAHLPKNYKTMKNNLSLSIPKACSEKWSSFTAASDGGFCGTCNKVVVDFTKMADDEILNFFIKQPTHTCGRFRTNQLKAYSIMPSVKINPGFLLLKTGFLSLLFFVFSNHVSAQSTPAKTKSEVVQYPGASVEKINTDGPGQVVKGVIKSEEDQLPMPGTNVYLKGSTVGIATDENGKFEFPVKLKEGDVLVFSFIGFDSQEYVIPKKVTEEIGIPMMLSSVTMMGEIAVDDVYTTEQSTVKQLWRKVKGLF